MVETGGVGQDRALVSALRAGDEEVFRRTVRAYHAPMLRLASFYVRSHAVAEEVVQETWIAAIRGLDRFEGRSTFKTWVFRILANQARTRAARERRSVPFTALDPGVDEDGAAGAGHEPGRFAGPDEPWPGHWTDPPRPWPDPSESAEHHQLRAVILAAIRVLPPLQRSVIALRDVEGWSAPEVCEALGIADGNQRVLLHRARVGVRAALDRYFEGMVTT